MDKFQILHKYNTFVRRGLAEPLTCEKDGWEYVVRLNDGETPMLQCLMCMGKLFPGEKMYAELEEKLK